MKKSLFSLLCSVFIFGFASAQNLVITEIMYNNPGAGADSLEFVEIRNSGTTSVNIKNFTIRTAFNDTFPDVNIPVGGYYVTAVNSAFFNKVFGKNPDKQWKQGALNNTGERIDLHNAAGVLIDSVRYSVLAPWPSAANGQGPSLVFCDLTKDNGSAANWTVSTTPAGTLNGISLYASPGKADCTNTAAVTAKSASVTTQKNLAVSVLLNTLANPASATIEITKQPVNGSAVINATSIVYTPKPDYCGNDVIEFKACVGANCDATGKININVQCPSTYEVTTIGKAKVDANNDLVPDNKDKFYELEGIVHSPNFGTLPTIQFCIIDATNKADGITVFRAGKDYGYKIKEGDKVKVRGKLTQFNGLTQLNLDTLFATGTGTVFAPTVVTKIDESSENTLVQLKNLTLKTPSQWTTGVGTSGFIVDAVDGAGNTIFIRIDKDIAEIYNSVGPKTAKFDCIGISSQFTTKLPPNDGYQLLPRKLTDLKITSAVNDLELAQFVKISPNPFVEKLTINITEKMNKIYVTDVSGRLVAYFKNPSESQTIETDEWDNGVYLIIVEKDGKQFTTKVVK